MKTVSRFLHVVLIALAALVAIAWVAGQVARIQVRQATVRSQPGYFMGETLGTIPYDTPTTISEIRGTWLKVAAEGHPQGWVNETAVFTRETNLHSDSSAVQETTSQDELSLAGRGFTQQMEAQYRQGNNNGNYPDVDRIEHDALYLTDDAQLLPFLREGGLMLQQGGAQ